jgi:hypothetical protein
MIPPDVANSLRVVVPDTQTAANRALSQPVTPAQRVADVLSNLVPGQRILAEVQALMSNGNYRAVVAQREFTLALPFAAKAGDVIELEVSETNGKVSLAFVANRSDAPPGKPGAESVPTTLSQTGKMIGDLLGGIDREGGKRAPPVALNGNQPLLEGMPKDTTALAAGLKQALTQSGMFYEAHQAKWVAGKLGTEALRQEPQGKLLAPAQPPPLGAPATRASSELAAFVGNSGLVDNEPGSAKTLGVANVAVNDAEGAKTADASKAQVLTVAARSELNATQTTTPQGIPRDIVPIVQQQLDALSTQQFVWQGQAWTGQPMWWEINEQADEGRGADEEIGRQWQTRLKLDLPLLGGLDAVLRLRPNGEISINIKTDSVSGEGSLRAASDALRAQYESAGLALVQLRVEHEQAGE